LGLIPSIYRKRKRRKNGENCTKIGTRFDILRKDHRGKGLEEREALSGITKGTREKEKSVQKNPEELRG